MKLSRILATGAAAALVGVSTLAIGGSAVADDYYVDDSEVGFVADGDAYLDSWFSGDVAPAAQGTATTTLSGLEMTAAAGGYQLLNGLTPTTDIVDLATGASLTVTSGNAYFQIPVYYDHDADIATPPMFTTLYPTGAGQAGLVGQWQTSGAIMDGGTVLYNARDADTLTNLVDAIGPGYEILAFGAFVLPNETATISKISWDGDNHWFMPSAPAGSVTPTSVTVDAFSDTGVTFTFTGYAPGENVVFAIDAPQYTDIRDSDPGVADANGVVTYSYVGPVDSAVGTYNVWASGMTSLVQSTTSFAVTANILPVTGADFTPALITGSLLLLLGGGFTIAARRRAIAKRH